MPEAQKKSPRLRPLSPHLQIYRMGLPATLSILHRLTGMVLYGGCLMWSLFLGMLTMDCASCTQGMLRSIPGYLFIFIWISALYYHLLNGIRHLCWDMGKGFELQTAYRTGWLVVALSGLLSVLTWAWLL
jgi:succinate dehydrogenase / fumarate reductase, cytochrome b subunit